MYADDTNISFQSSNLDELEKIMISDLSRLNIWLKANRLSLNIAKTQYMIIGTRQKLITQDLNRINVRVDDTPIKRVQHTKSLGLIIDDNLQWKNHINSICKKISSGIGVLKRVRRFICKDTAEKVYSSLIDPYFNYCSPVWNGLGSQLSIKLQKLQNRAARVIAERSYETPSSNLLQELNWNKLNINRKKHTAILMYKTLNGNMPHYLQEIFTPRVSFYDLRDMENKLFVPKPRTACLKRSFGYSGAVLWNSLPPELRSAQTLPMFKRGSEGWLSSVDSQHGNHVNQ